MNNRTVIAFYPGAGGNRYLNYLNNKEYQTLNKNYDYSVKNQLVEHRYLLNGVNKYNKDYDYKLTHCLNQERIVEIFEPDNIILIKSDFKKSLSRAYKIHGLELYSRLYKTPHYNEVILSVYNDIKDKSWPVINDINEFIKLDTFIQHEVTNFISNHTSNDNVNFAWSVISWHHEYYDFFRPSIITDDIVTIPDSDSEFSCIMNTELSNYNDDIFEFCWNMFNQYGKNAPIIDLYNQHKS